MATCPDCHAQYPSDVSVCATDGAQLVDDEVFAATDRDIVPGDRIGEYTVESKIGEGGFGAVYRAVHPVIGKVAAIKVLGRRYSSDREMVSRFIAEARAANRIKNKHIIDIFAFGALPDGRQYYAMELLDGVTLDGHLERLGRLSPEEAIPILLGIARALDAAHAAGIAHRDLKPENVFLAIDEDHGFEAKLLDFGIAKLLDDRAHEHRTRTGAPIGTPYYMSPEQCRGKQVDHRTDIYSFGVVVYRLLTGALPFEASTHMDVMMQHVSEEAPPMSKRVAGLAVELDAPVAHMLEKDPAKRPASVQAALEELAAAARAAGHDVQVPAGKGAGSRSGDRWPSSDAGLVPNISPTARQKLAAADTLAQATTASIGASGSQAPTRRPGVALAVGVAALSLVVVVGFTLAGRSRKASVAESPASAAPLASAASAPAAQPVLQAAVPDRVELRLDTVPKDAEVFLGDLRIGSAPGPLRIDRGTQKLVLVLKAPGHVPRQVEFTPSSNGVISATLDKLGSKPHATPGKKPEVEF